ncbi:MAG: pantetheine-phosphate adenylyltransferase [Bacillota bacterium]
MRIAVCPGSFDPITYGHIDIIERGTALFDRIIVAVAVNPGKAAFFSMEERVEMIKTTVKQYPNVSVASFDGLITDFADQNGAIAIIRGLRAMTDFEYELQMALFNKHLKPNIETVYLMSRNEYSYISSSAVKQLIHFGADVSAFVPPYIVEQIKSKIAQRSANGGK